MKSHTYEFSPSDLLPLLVSPLLVVAGFALAMHGGARMGLLPAPRPTLDTDRTILIHQADASRQSNAASLLLLGDSSCLMNVAARQLTAELRQTVLNLGTLSYLDADAHGRLLREYAAANPGRLRTVVLLMHPEALRRTGAESFHLAIFTNYLAGTDHHRRESVTGQFNAWSGLDICQGRLVARFRQTPLAGRLGRQHGFSRDLEKFLTWSQGSLPELDSAPLVGSAEYRLAASLENGARQFKAALPPGVKLFVGLTPVPEQLAGRDFAVTHAEILRRWGAWLGADAVLTNLPATLPNENFARSTHLRPQAVPDYTTALAKSLAGQID